MTNLEIDQKLAEALGYRKVNDEKDGFNWSDDDSKTLFSWHPTVYMGDAWEAAERFEIDDIRRLYTGEWLVWKRGASTTDGLTAQAETAPLAICLAALKVIENQEVQER